MIWHAFCMFPVSLHHRDLVSERSGSSILGMWFGTCFGMFPFSIHHRDLASERSSCSTLGIDVACVAARSGSNIRGCDLVCCLACVLSASAIEILLPKAQAPASWVCDLACFLECFLSASTIEILLPNAQARASWGCDLACFFECFLSASP